MNSKFCENCKYKPKHFRLHYNISTKEAYITGNNNHSFSPYCIYRFKKEYKHEFIYGYKLQFIKDEWWKYLELSESCPFYDKYLIEELNQNEF